MKGHIFGVLLRNVFVFIRGNGALVGGALPPVNQKGELCYHGGAGLDTIFLRGVGHTFPIKFSNEVFFTPAKIGDNHLTYNHVHLYFITSM